MSRVLCMLACVMATAACRELAHLEGGTCGNGAVDPGEDCDFAVDPALGPSTACVQCHYACGDGATCPAGWGCGSDAICRHATGVLVAGEAIACPHSDLAIADLDGDSRGDVVAFDARGVLVAFADVGVVVATSNEATGLGLAA